MGLGCVETDGEMRRDFRVRRAKGDPVEHLARGFTFYCLPLPSGADLIAAARRQVGYEARPGHYVRAQAVS